MTTESLKKMTCDGCRKVLERDALAIGLPAGWVSVRVESEHMRRSGEFCSKACAGRWVAKRDRTKKAGSTKAVSADTESSLST